jgi:hypothetical protein
MVNLGSTWLDGGMLRLSTHTHQTHKHTPLSSWECVFIITDKAKLVGEEGKGVGVMKDEVIKLEEIEASHTLGG